METIEIRQNKKTLIPMLVLLTLAVFGITYYIYFSGRYDSNTLMKIVYVFFIFMMGATVYISAKKFFKNEPVLTLTKSEIIINEAGKAVSLLWEQVVDWKIEDNDGAHYLVIETHEQKKKLNISWLDKRPAEIEELLKKCKRQPIS
jgi:hypothetical protein